MTTIDKQIAHLKKDKILKKAIEQIGVLTTHKTNTDLYGALIRAIVSQQLSVKAADTIYKRFIAIFKDGKPEATLILKLKDEQLRAVGLSYQKCSYIKNIAQFSLTEGLDYKLLKLKTDDELISHLIKIKGVGQWTVEMLLMFSLNRENVFPKDDLGIQNGIKKLYNLNSEKKELLKEMLMVSEKWHPYCTLACRYIWRYKDKKD